MKRVLALLFAGALFAAGCSGGGSTETEPVELFPSTTTVGSATTTLPLPTTSGTATEIALADHALTFQPSSDSFSFENFGGGTAPADLTVNMARRLYGDQQVCSNVTDNQCTPYPVILQLISQANRSMKGGLCEGLAVLSLRLAGDSKTLQSFQGASTVASLVKEDPALLSELVYWYVTQFAVEVQEEASSYLERHPAQLAEILLRDFEAAEAGRPSTGYTIGIYSDEGGHAVTPYRVVEVEGGYRIYIYDSNWPSDERWIDVHSSGWTYALAATNPTEPSSAWSGSTGTMELTPMVSRSGPFQCSFCPSDTDEESGTMLTVASSGDKQMAIKIETEDGDRLGYYDGKFINEIEGATYRYLISGPSTADPVLVFLPPGVATFTADVEEIMASTPTLEEGAQEPEQTTTDVTTLEEPGPEVEEEQQYSLLLLNEDKSIQIEAAVVDTPQPTETGPTEEEVIVEETSLISFSETSVEIAEVEDATVAIAIDSLEVEIEIEAGQEVQLVIAPEPEPPSVDDPTVPIDETPPAPVMLDIAVQSDEGEILAEVEVDLTQYLIEEQPEEPPIGQGPDTTLPPAEEVPAAPVILSLSFDEEEGEISIEEEEVEAWVASDAEYYQAIIDDTLEEVIGESYAEEIEEREEWDVESEEEFDLTLILETVDDEYWEDDRWEETEYDDEWYEEEELSVELFAQVEEIDDWFEEEAWEPDEEWVEEWAEEEEAFILEEMGLEEWDEDLLGPAPTETIEWTDEEWESYEAEMEAQWEEEDPASWEDEDLGSEDGFWLDTEEEWDDWQEEFWPEDAEWCEECEEGPWDEEEWTDTEPPMEDFTEWDDSWDEEEWTAEDEEALILEELGLDEWPEDWGPSPGETWGWTEEDWDTWDEENEPVWDEFPEEEESAPPEEEEEWEEPWLEEELADEGSLDDPEWEDEETLDTEDTQEPSDEEPQPDTDLPPETEVDEEQVGEEEVPTEDLEPVWENPYADCMGTSACENPPGGYDSWDDYEADNDPNWVPPPEPEEPEYVPPPPPPPPPPPVYWYDEATEIWDEEGNTVLSSNTLSTTTESTATSVLARGTDGHWYETITTETTTSLETQAVSTVSYTTYSNTSWCGGSQYDSSCGSTGAVAGNSYNTVSTAAAQTATTVTTATEVVPASCSQGGFTGLGDWCIVDSNSRNDYDYVAFSVPTAAEENEACDCTDGDGLMDIRIDAESNLTRAQFGSNNEHADPYIYLNHDTDSDDGDHSGDTSEITVGGSIESDDDHGRDCGNTCTNPPSTATDPDETPNVTLANGDPVIENVSDMWDSRIEREMSAGDYVVRASVYNNSNSGWYRLTIRDADVPYPPEED